MDKDIKRQLPGLSKRYTESSTEELLMLGKERSGIFYHIWLHLLLLSKNDTKYFKELKVDLLDLNSNISFLIESGAKYENLKGIYGILQLLMQDAIDKNNVKKGIFYSSLYDHFTILGRIINGYNLYLDEFISFTYHPPCVEYDFKQGDIILATNNNPCKLWLTDSRLNNTSNIPLSSFKNLKKVVKNYKGNTYRGKLLYPQSEKFSRLIGLEIREDWAYLKSEKQKGGKGFN